MFRVHFKILVLRFMGPSYIMKLFCPYSQVMVSSDRGLFMIPNKGDSALAPKLWNSLPISLCALCPWHGSGFNPFTSVKHFETVLCPEKCYKNKLYLHIQTFLGLTSRGTDPCYKRPSTGFPMRCHR